MNNLRYLTQYHVTSVKQSISHVSGFLINSWKHYVDRHLTLRWAQAYWTHQIAFLFLLNDFTRQTQIALHIITAHHAFVQNSWKVYFWFSSFFLSLLLPTVLTWNRSKVSLFCCNVFCIRWKYRGNMKILYAHTGWRSQNHTRMAWYWSLWR